jgi:hypothetical protein
VGRRQGSKSIAAAPQYRRWSRWREESIARAAAEAKEEAATAGSKSEEERPKWRRKAGHQGCVTADDVEVVT